MSAGSQHAVSTCTNCDLICSSIVVHRSALARHVTLWVQPSKGAEVERHPLAGAALGSAVTMKASGSLRGDEVTQTTR
jgi:hypothetical protein